MTHRALRPVRLVCLGALLVVAGCAHPRATAAGAAPTARTGPLALGQPVRG
jgi:hypothetical protein